MNGRYRIHLMFEWGGGALWPGDPATLRRFDVGPLEQALPLSAGTRAELERLSAWHDQALDWSDPAGPSPWSEAEFRRFDAAAEASRAGLQAELGADFQVVYVALGG